MRDCNYAHFYDSTLTYYKDSLQDFDHRQFAKGQLSLSKLMLVKNHLSSNRKNDKKKRVFPEGMKILKELETAE